MDWLGPNIPNRCHVDVVFSPKMATETLNIRPLHMLTNQITYEVYHMKVPIKAYFSLTDFPIHVKIPPPSFLNAVLYSVTIKATYDKTIARVEEIKASDMVHGYLPSGILESTNSYVKYLTVWSILSVVFLLSPTSVRDQIHKTRATQWSSKKGRRILNTQLAAAGFSALALTLINLIVYAIPFLMQQPLIFRNFQLFSFQIFRIPWFDWTYGQYLIVMALMIVVLAVAAGGLTVFLSQYSGNYVAMLLKVLPLFAVLAYISSSRIMDQAFFAENSLSKVLAMPGAEFLGVTALAALGIGLRIMACRRQLHREL